MAAICQSGAISTVSTKEQFLRRKSMCAKFQIDISKTEEEVYIYSDRRTNRQTEKHTAMSKSTKPLTLIIILFSGYFKLGGKLNIICSSTVRTRVS